MKKITLYFILLLMSSQLEAQEIPVDSRIEALERQKQEIIAEGKAALKEAVKKINLELEKGTIDWEEAERRKGEAAKKYARIIRIELEPINRELAELNPRLGPEKEDENEDPWEGKSRYSRTSTHLVLAAGFNKTISPGQSIENSDFKIGGSRFFELGLAWKTRVFETSNWLRVRYGFSFQFNGLKPTDNRYFVENGDLTVLQEYPFDLEKSKFRMDNLVFPVHFEFGPSTKIESDRSVWFSTKDKLRIGLGGYAGFSLGERQKLKYEKDGEDVKKKLKNDYNTEDFVYGLSGYLGWSGAALYVKYDLNNIFEEPNAELHNVSVGLRFDVN